MGADKEFLFIDETGSPGAAGPEMYGVVALYLPEECVHRVRQHMTAFRYHHDVVKELKDQRNPDKLTPQTRRLVLPLAEMTVAGDIAATANWTHKPTWKANGAPHLNDAQKFRAFQIRLMLERHLQRRPWLSEADVVMDRWKMTEDQRANIEKYLKDNFRLRPRIRHVTTVDSVYVDPIQIADIYTRFLRRAVEGTDVEVQKMAHLLMDIQERKRGLF